MKKVKLSQNKLTLVENNDFKKVNQYKWFYQHGYAATHQVDGKFIYLHRFLLDATKGDIVDHINRNKLDNRRSNLRFITQSQNVFNSKILTTNKSGYRGVYYKKDAKKWCARIEIAKKLHYLGYFNNPKEAAAAYNQKGLAELGIYAFQNVI